MKSTGEVMGIAVSFEEAYAKCLRAAGLNIGKFDHINIQGSSKFAIEKFLDRDLNKSLIYKLQEI